MQEMELVPVSKAIGMEVLGIDLRRSLPSRQLELLRRAYAQHQLLLFRDQDLTGDEHVAFVRHFGPTLATGAYQQGWRFVSNVRPDGLVPEGALAFHFDLAFTEEPLWGLSLYALEVPDDGAPTVFASSVRAAACLPDGLRQQLTGRRVLNVQDFQLPSDRRMRERDVRPGQPRAQHPVIGPHPRTGETVLFVCEQQSDRIIDMDPDASEAILEQLFSDLYAPDNLYVHRWKVGDLVLWDNVAVQHGRPAMAKDAPRTLRRVTIAERSLEDLVANLAELLRS
jgi:taurine dioxygenase